MAVKNSFEKKIDRLHELSNLLEKGDVPLEDLLKSFEEGIKVYRECHTILEETESKIQMIVDEENQANNR